jgi:hypothetical protein
MLMLLFVKHYLADFVFQTNYMAKHKQKYLYLDHSLIHMVFTLTVLMWFMPLSLAATLACLDFAIHHNVDYIKTKLSKNLTQADRMYWIYFGADQLLHALTYLLILYLAKI